MLKEIVKTKSYGCILLSKLFEAFLFNILQFDILKNKNSGPQICYKIGLREEIIQESKVKWKRYFNLISQVKANLGTISDKITKQL